jgi:hypothetical protein
MGLKDGLPDLEVHSTTVSGTTAQFGDAVLGAGAIGNSEIADGACSGTKVSTEFSPIKTGSPTTDGVSVQFGVVTATDVAVWGVFGTAFAGDPTVFLTPNASGTHATEAFVVGSPISVGSFSFIGQSGLEYNYLALGSGRV